MTRAARVVRVRGALLFAAALALVTAREARAQVSDAELAARRVLLDQAAEARAQSNPRLALDLAQRAGRIQMTPSIRLFIAEMQAAMGNYVEALGAADRCAQEADRDAAASRRQQILDACRAVSATARQRVGYVTVTVTGAAGATIRVGETTLSDALVGVPFVVNTGAVRVQASAPGFDEVAREVRVAPGETARVELALQRTPRRSGEPPAGGVIAAAGEPRYPAPTEPRVPVAPPRAGVPVGAVVLMGAGAVSLGASLALYFGRNGALAGCAVRDTYIECMTDEQVTAARGANTFAGASIATLGVGAAAVVGGAVWLGLAMASRPRTESVVAAPAVLSLGAGGTVVGLAGRF